MGHWIQEHKGFSAVHLQIVLLVLGVMAACAGFIYYAYALPR